MIEINDVFVNGNALDSKYSLPPHHRCANHTLNLVTTRDSEKAISDVNYKRQLRITFAKMQSLWNKQDRTSVFADSIHDTLNSYITAPKYYSVEFDLQSS